MTPDPNNLDAALSAAGVRTEPAETRLGDGPVTDWKNAALILGENLASTGPDGYYGFTPQQWLEWARQAVRA